MPASPAEQAGGSCLVVSLDLELHWGVRDRVGARSPQRANLLGAREAVPAVLARFGHHGVAATWATVGMLFARDRGELEACMPERRPRYADARLSPYTETVGDDEDDDPLHFGASLVEAILRAPRQEVASHTFSHYYCLEPGQEEQAFRADLEAARRLAALRGVKLSSIVLPRNQWNPGYAGALLDAGFSTYRGNQAGFAYRPGGSRSQSPWVRGARLADAYVDVYGSGLTRWDELVEPSGLCNVRASRYLRPWSRSRRSLEPLRLRRVVSSMEAAATTGRIFHLWWHPHDFGQNLDENLRFLEEVLVRFDQLRENHAMVSLTMGEVARHAAARDEKAALP